MGCKFVREAIAVLGFTLLLAACEERKAEILPQAGEQISPMVQEGNPPSPGQAQEEPGQGDTGTRG